MTTLDRTETQIQNAFMKAWKEVAPDDVQVFHVPNGEKRSTKTAGKLKRMGVQAGVPDIAVTLPDGRSAYIEFKRPGEKIKRGDDQDKFRIWCARHGVPWAVCHNEANAIGVLWGWISEARRMAA